MNDVVVSFPFFISPSDGQLKNAGNLVVTADINLAVSDFTTDIYTTFNNSGNVTLQAATPGAYSLLRHQRH